TGTNDATYGSFAERCDLCTSQDANTFPVPDMERMGLAARVRYDLGEGLTFRGDVKYVVTETPDTLFPPFNHPFQSPVVYVGPAHPANNAFITPELDAVLLNGFMTTGAPFVAVSRLNADIGGRNADTTRKTFRAVAALDGVADAGLAEVDWELSYNL